MITFEWSDWYDGSARGHPSWLPAPQTTNSATPAAHAHRRNAQVWWIQSVYTRKAHRRKGHYNALYQHVKAACREARAAGLRLYVDTHNKAAQELYARQGMRSHYLVYEDMESY
jgi:GNAT superfamily N-acetyltransferase